METFYWHTEQAHSDNNETMSEYLDEHLPLEFTIVYQDGTMAEVRNSETAERFEVHASGNGDSFNHKVEFNAL
jgi:hypothetical protein